MLYRVVRNLTTANTKDMMMMVYGWMNGKPYLDVIVNDFDCDQLVGSVTVEC